MRTAYLKFQLQKRPQTRVGGCLSAMSTICYTLSHRDQHQANSTGDFDSGVRNPEDSGDRKGRVLLVQSTALSRSPITVVAVQQERQISKE